jgi:uridine kinase
MLARRIQRDVAERGRDVGGVIDQYLRSVKPAYDNFVLPSSRHADIIVPGFDNGVRKPGDHDHLTLMLETGQVAIELISEHVKRQLAQRAAACLREKIGRSHTVLRKQPSPLPSLKIREASLESNVILMEQTAQLQGIYTILRNETSTRVDFIFYADRLATLICERSMCELPFRPRTVTCPTSELVVGKELDAQVSVVQLPELFERRLVPVWSSGSHRTHST